MVLSFVAGDGLRKLTERRLDASEFALKWMNGTEMDRFPRKTESSNMWQYIVFGNQDLQKQTVFIYYHDPCACMLATSLFPNNSVCVKIKDRKKESEKEEGLSWLSLYCACLLLSEIGL